jgi:hypothetical protein
MGTWEKANVPPLQIQLKPGVKPMRVPASTFSPPQNEELGLIRRNPASAWASPPLILPKPGPKGFRFTVDLRVPNAQTVPTVWLMPHLAGSLTHFEVARTMENLISAKATGVWVCTLTVKNAKVLVHLLACLLQRVLHGTKNATMHMQATIESIIQDFKPHAEAWLDDVATHAKLEDEYLDALDRFFW